MDHLIGPDPHQPVRRFRLRVCPLCHALRVKENARLSGIDVFAKRLHAKTHYQLRERPMSPETEHGRSLLGIWLMK
jgi:hypothetical protein